MPDHQSAPAPATYSLDRLLPPGVAFLIKERPLLWNEPASEYDALREWIFDQMRPRDVAEILQTKEFVDNYWEDRQMRRLKIAAIHDKLPFAATDVCEPWSDSDPYRREKRDEVWVLASEAALAPDEEKGPEGMSEFNARAKKCAVSPDMIHYNAYKMQADWLDRMDRRLSQLQNRRDRIIRQMDERRAALGAMARDLVRREAETIDFEIAK